MTPQRSKIFHAFTRGEPIARIAESCGVSYGQAWSQLRRAVAELEHKNPSALDAVRWENYLMLMRIAGQAFAAFERSAEGGRERGDVPDERERGRWRQGWVSGSSLIAFAGMLGIHAS